MSHTVQWKNKKHLSTAGMERMTKRCGGEENIEHDLEGGETEGRQKKRKKKKSVSCCIGAAACENTRAALLSPHCLMRRASQEEAHAQMKTATTTQVQ